MSQTNYTKYFKFNEIEESEEIKEEPKEKKSFKKHWKNALYNIKKMKNFITQMNGFLHFLLFSYIKKSAMILLKILQIGK